jgi:hypothetical protein
MVAAAGLYEKPTFRGELRMITLYTFGPNFGLPDASPFALKSEVQLKMAGLGYQLEFGGLRASCPISTMTER